MSLAPVAIIADDLTGTADPTSMVEAIVLAAEMARTGLGPTAP
jgi:hypothetical protein